MTMTSTKLGDESAGFPCAVVRKNNWFYTFDSHCRDAQGNVDAGG